MSPMINNMLSNPSKMEITIHLMNQNEFMQNHIKINNHLVFILFQDCYQIPSYNLIFLIIHLKIIIKIYKKETFIIIKIIIIIQMNQAIKMILHGIQEEGHQFFSYILNIK